MNYFGLTAAQLPEYKRLTAHIMSDPSENLPVLVTGLSHIHKAHILAALSAEQNMSFPFLVLVDSENQALKITEDINAFSAINGENVAVLYPAKDINLGASEVHSREYEHKRLAVLSGLLSGEVKIVLATPEAAAQLTIPPDILSSRTIKITPDSEVNLDDLTERLVKNGYSRCDMIEGAAQFSIRGSIIDIYPVNSNYPVRIELWGDNVDTVSAFDIESQRRIDTLKEVRISPASELIFESNEVFIERLNQILKKIKTDAADKITADIERIRSNVAPKNIDKYFPLAYNNEVSLFDYINKIIVCENTNCTESFRAASLQHDEDIIQLFESNELCKGLEKYMLTRSEFKGKISDKASAYFDTFMRGGDLRLSEILNISALQLAGWSGEYKVLVEEINSFFRAGYAVAVFAGTEKAAKTLAQDLKDDNIAADYSENPKKLYAKRAYILSGSASGGYDYKEAKCALITQAQAQTAKQNSLNITKKKKRSGEEIRNLSDINIGDYIVHNSYGIGIFEGVTKLTHDKISKDYIKIKYAGTDVLYIPVTQLDMISRYIGNTDSASLKLNKLHTDAWQKSKTKAKAAAAELADELIELYSKRMKSRGFQFSQDSKEQVEFENHFSFIETDDQLRCVEEIKYDMESVRPMDRLLCGDVGFGKTEVALRAAFKCVMDGKQCALLCPTTVLAWQHYQTALKRMDGFPINIELLSRFRTAKEVKAVLEKLKKGIIDMVIGTHRLVQSDVIFKDLGLVIIDEEQRFGVAHKEKFKEMFSGVDILTLSATPIPRTLNMAMSGIRDMSVIETPPQDRQPITTYVIEHDWGVITNAIMKELRRNGQVYYIHNRIESIMSCAAKIHELCPEASIGIAHGRMSEDELLEVWRKLLDGEINVLVCTTLIETGIDVSNVNTLIIENADYMGLAQLHQLRGRVGRTNRRAFAYFSFKRGKVLSEIATKRLNAIREFTQFGSGFRIAMRDLEIRGAGSILGASQSGHLSAVGYDMYLQLLNEAVIEKRGGTPKIKEECLVDIKIDAFIPETYISNQAQRITCYKRIAEIGDRNDVFDVTDELIDRYGELPKSVTGLIDVAEIRNMAQSTGISEIIQDGGTINLYTNKPSMEGVSEAIGKLGNRVLLNLTGRTGISLKLEKKEQPIDAVKTFLSAYTGLK